MAMRMPPPVVVAPVVLKAVVRWLQPLIVLAVFAAALSQAQPLRAAGQDGNSPFLESLSIATVPAQILMVCHGFGCTYRSPFLLTAERIARLRRVLGTPRSA